MDKTKWKWWETGLWWYSVFIIAIYLFLFLMVILFPSNKQSAPSDATYGAWVILITILPVFIFLILEGKRHFPDR